MKCESCTAELEPSDRDRKLHFVLPFTVAFIGFGAASQFPAAYQHLSVLALGTAGVLIGMVAHYRLAAYEYIGADSLPEARSTTRDAT